MAASITLTTTFVDITVAGQFSTATVALATIPPPGNVSLVSGVLHVTGAAANLQFTVDPVSGDTNSYNIIGVYAKGSTTGTFTDSHGKGSFDLPNPHLNGNQCNILDKWVNFHAPLASGGVPYELFFVIQRQSDYAVGIIDPDVQNDD